MRFAIQANKSIKKYRLNNHCYSVWDKSHIPRFFTLLLSHEQEKKSSDLKKEGKKMNKDLVQKLEETSTEFFGKDSLHYGTVRNDDGTYTTIASIKGLPESIEASDPDANVSRYKALEALQYLLADHLEKNMFPTRPIEEYQEIVLTIRDLMNDGGLIQNFLNDYEDKYDDEPQILIRQDGDEFECIVESNESNIHVRRNGKTKLEAIKSAVRMAATVMTPMRLKVNEVKF